MTRKKLYTYAELDKRCTELVRECDQTANDKYRFERELRQVRLELATEIRKNMALSRLVRIYLAKDAGVLNED